MSVPQLPYDYPLLPLDTLREFIGYNPYLWWGLSNDKVVGRGSQCNSVIYEYDWQAYDQIGRSTMRRFILDAELDLRREIKYSVAPHYSEETITYLQQNTMALTTQYNTAQWGLGDPFGMWTSVQLQEGYIKAMGYEDLTLIENATVTITDANLDGLLDTFTCTVTTDETNTEYIGVYFTQADRWDDDDTSEQWRINPVKVKINGDGTVTITGRSWLIVKPILYQQAIQQSPLDPDDTDIYVEQVAVYTRRPNGEGMLPTNSQATMEWETSPAPNWWYCPMPSPVGYSTDPATVGYAVARCGIRNPKLGIVIPAQATFNAENGLWYEDYPVWNWRPNRVKVRYYAGMDLDNDGQMNRKIRDAVCMLAVANLPERICACDVANKALHYWQWDLARIANGVEQYATTRGQLSNIFGSKRGQVMAWNKVKHMVLHRGVTY